MRATVRVDTVHGSAVISPLIYGQYFEHVGDCVYPGVWDADSPHADEHGLRRDVLEAATDLQVPVVRWPGGCFADQYHWLDGVGARESRPVRRNWHWGGTEPNSFGTDEFLAWCGKVGARPYVNVNLGTGSLIEALRWMDYCDGTEETADVLRRRENGRDEPYDVRYWGIGNETWGVWEAGHTDAREYARTLANWARFAKAYDPDASVLAVGSSEGRDPLWDDEVLNTAGDYIDHLTQHLYGCSTDRSTGAEFLSVAFTPVYFETRLRSMVERVAACDRDIRVALDEWNIRHYTRNAAGHYELDRSSPRNLQDCVFAAGVFNAMIRLSPGISMANHVFLVNGNAVLNVYGDQLVKTPLYHLFRQYRTWMRGRAVRVETECLTIPTPQPTASEPGHPELIDDLPTRSPYLDAVAARDEADGLTLALVNRHPEEQIEAFLDLPGDYRPVTAWTLWHADPYAVNDQEHPDRITPTTVPVRGTSWVCPPHSVTLVRAERQT